MTTEDLTPEIKYFIRKSEPYYNSRGMIMASHREEHPTPALKSRLFSFFRNYKDHSIPFGKGFINLHFPAVNGSYIRVSVCMNKKEYEAIINSKA